MPRQRLVLASGPLLELAIDISKGLSHRSLIERFRSNSTTRVSPSCIAAPVRPTSPASGDGMRHPRTTFRMRFTASELTPGRKLVNNRRCLLMAFLGRKVKPRNVNCTFGKYSVRLLSWQYTIFDFSGCIVNPHSASRSAMDRMTCSACCLTAAVDNRVIRIPGKRTRWIGALHPDVERIVHEQVHQNRTDHPALRRATFPRHSCRLLSSRTAQSATVRCTAVSSLP